MAALAITGTTGSVTIPGTTGATLINVCFSAMTGERIDTRDSKHYRGGYRVNGTSTAKL